MRFGENTDDDSGTDNGDGSGEKRASKKAGELLSFIPKTYSLKCDGRIEAVQVYGIQKRYRPEKHYVFILKITRENEREATFLFRYRDCRKTRHPKYHVPNPNLATIFGILMV
jgi:hypothetical protein